MINTKEIIEDKLNDDIGVLLKKISANLKFTKEKKLGIEELKKSLKKYKHLTFEAQYQNYHLSAIGSSYLYKVPKNKRGYLSKFKIGWFLSNSFEPLLFLNICHGIWLAEVAIKLTHLCTIALFLYESTPTLSS